MYRISIFFALIIWALLCCACNSGDHTNKLADELRMFMGTAIEFPDNMLIKGHDGQIPDTTLLHRPFKMVIYMDQKGCESCKLQALVPVHVFTLENRPHKNFGVVVILNPSHIESAEHFLEEMRFRQTVFYDLDGSFERLNLHLPKNERFRTFLLNEDNKVVLVGNPIRNANLRKLYLEALKR